VEYETKRVDICCRVNADEPGRETTAVEYLWAHLSGLIIVAEQFLHTWPGLFYKASQSPVAFQHSMSERSFLKHTSVIQFAASNTMYKSGILNYRKCFNSGFSLLLTSPSTDMTLLSSII